MNTHMRTGMSWKGRPPLLALLALLLMGAMLTQSGFANTANAQGTSGDEIWSDTSLAQRAALGEPLINTKQHRDVTLNVSALEQLLQATPMERSAAAQSTPVIFSLPLPDGTFGRFHIVESPIMAPELAAKFPEITTYAGQGIDDRTAIVRFDWTPAGFHAMILSTGDTVFIDPYSRDDTTNYISYLKSDFVPPEGKSLKEVAPPNLPAASQPGSTELPASTAPKASGSKLRTYRLAMAADVEYTTFHGGSVAGALAAIVTTVNRVDGICEREVAVRLVLVANNDLLIYTAEPDPYTNSDAFLLLGQNQANVDAVIGDANYDIGHVATTGGGGVAYLGVVCTPGQKAGGVTGSPSPVGDPYDVDYFAHEIGHQFGGNHTFNDNTNGSCAGNRNAATAYEPGSGSTIQAYAGICPFDDLQPNSDPYFSAISFDEIVDYTTVGNGNNCPVISASGNTAPVVNAGPGGFTIPRQTPFTLTGSATDADGDALTYGWEEFDLGAASVANNPLNPPFFRFFPPTTHPSRTFPKWSDIVNNTTTIGEILPNVTLAMNFRLTARDNRLGGGGVDYASTIVNVTTAAGPFLVTTPNTAVTWTGAARESVAWNVAGTTAAPVSCPNVNILLSTDGGLTYPTTLAMGVPNNGSASVTAPNVATTTARVQVACANNIFFDISNANFTINPTAATGTIIIRKATSPAGGTGFGFTSDVPGAASFTLNDGENQTSNNVAIGSYTVSENSLTGYSLTNLVCTDPDNGSTVNVGTRTATIHLDAGEMVDCTFTNTAVAIFPQNGILDNFNRAAGAVGSNWAGTTSINSFKIVRNRVRVLNGGGQLYWKPSSFGVNQEAFVTLTRVAPATTDQDLLLKVQGGANPNWSKGAIEIRYAVKARAVRVDTYRPGSGWFTYPQISVAFSDGDQLGARALANGNVQVYKNGALVGTVTMNAADRTFFNSKGGAIGVLFGGRVAIFDNFGGGNVTP